MMTNDIEKTRPAFEAAVIERLKESGFLEVEIRVECLKPRVGDGYQDEVINAGWHYWKAALTATPVQQATEADVNALQALGRFSFAAQRWGWEEDQGSNPRVIDDTKADFDASYAALKKLLSIKQISAAELLNKLAEVSAAVGFGAGEPATEIAGHFVSFLAANPVHIERFMRDAHEMVIDGTFTYDQGNLTYRAQDGTIRHPDELRAANAQKATTNEPL